MNTKNHFSRIKTNLEILRRIGVKVPDGDFLCPECFSPFNEYEISKLTEEGRRSKIECKTGSGREQRP